MIRKRSRGVTAGAETLVGGPVEQALTPRKIFNDIFDDFDTMTPKFLDPKGTLPLTIYRNAPSSECSL